MKLSVVIITYNEEQKIEGALQSVRDVADEIIVVDRYSDDDTVKIAKCYTDKVFLRKWTNFADQKNYANQKTVHEWILSLDADERLSAELQAEILELKSEEPQAAGFSMPRKVFYLGRWIRHSGWYPDRKIRLFQKDKAHWEGEYVHERLVIGEPVRKLRGDIHHFTYRSIGDHLERINVFSDLGAQKLYACRKKCRWPSLVFLPLFRFLKAYVLKAGFLDGFPGLVICTLHGYAIFVRYAKLREIWKKGERIEPYPN